MSVSGDTGDVSDTVNGATLTITDDDAAPGDIGLTLSSTSVAESASATTITVTAALGGSTRFAADKAITVEVGASTDGATEGTDYDTVADFTITLSAGSASVTGTFSIDPTQDVLDEGTGESVSVSGDTGDVSDTVNGATLTITDDDAAPGDIGLTLSSTSVAESASATTVTVTAALGGSTRFSGGQGYNRGSWGEHGRRDGGYGLRHGCGLHDNSFRGERQRDGDVQHRSYTGRARRGHFGRA